MNFNFNNKDNKNKESNQNDFIKNLQSQVKNKKKSLKHYEEIVKSKNV